MHTNLRGIRSPVPPSTSELKRRALKRVRVTAGPEAAAVTPLTRLSGVGGVPALKAGSGQEATHEARSGEPAGNLAGAIQSFPVDVSGAAVMPGRPIRPLGFLPTVLQAPVPSGPADKFQVITKFRIDLVPLQEGCHSALGKHRGR